MIPQEGWADEFAPARIDEVSYPYQTTPAIAGHRVVDHTIAVPLFRDDVWDLLALEADPSRAGSPLTFAGWPDGFRDFAKHVAYVLINHGNPPALVEAPKSNYAQWPAAKSISAFLQRLRAQVEWLMGDGATETTGPPVEQPADLDSEHLNAVRRWVEALDDVPHGRNQKLEVLIRVWHLSPWLPETARLPEPEWRTINWRLRRESEENRTERIPQDVMGPLLEWAVAFVTLFADDILAADVHYRERRVAIPGSTLESSTAFLERYAREGRALPLSPLNPEHISWQAVSYLHGRPVGDLPSVYRRRFRDRIPLTTEPAVLDLRPTARFHGKPWIPAIALHDVQQLQGAGEPSDLLGHLRTACLIVCAYLTGARPDEVLAFEHGAAREPLLRPGGSKLYLIDGVVWKGVRRRPDGSPGAPEHASWATVSGAATAVRIAERVNHTLGRGSGPLFAPAGKRAWATLPTAWITEFVEFVNTRLVPHSVDPEAFLIPDDDNPLTLRRFRRTLAWFINNRPDGEVVTAVQYQQFSDTLVSGYAGTKESGMRDLLLEEDWQHRRRTIEHVGALLEEGREITGPAATRAAAIAIGMPRFLTPADERRLRRDANLVIYDNPAAVALCVYDEASALCVKRRQPGGPAAPTLLQCVDGCPCCARTDEHLDQLKAEAASLRSNAEVAPKPIAQSWLARAERNELIVSGARTDHRGESPQ